MGSKRMPGKPGMLAVAVFAAVGLVGNPGSAMPGSILDVDLLARVVLKVELTEV